MATVTVTQAKLVLNAFAANFQNNLLAKDLVTWNKFDGEMNDRNGLQVVEQVDPSYIVTETTDGVKDLSGGVQDTVFGSEIYKINKTFGASMGWGDFVKIRDIGEARESHALARAAANLAESIDRYILDFISDNTHGWLGTPANGIDTWADIVQGYTRLKERGVEDEGLRAVLTYQDKEDLGEAVIAYNATDGLSTDSFRSGFSGKVGGIPTMFTQMLATHTAGTDHTTVTVDGADQDVDYSAVATSSAPGRYMTQTLNVTGVTATTGTITAGSVFTIDSVYEWDPRANKSTGRLQQFTVVTGGTGNGSADVALVIYPAIIVQGSSDVNTAHATVDAAPADTAAITFIETASATSTPRLLLHKDAVIVNTADLIMPASGTASRVNLTKVPASVRMWQDSTFATGEHRVRFDIALTANVRANGRPRMIRINGQ